MIAAAPFAIHMAHMAARLCSPVTIYTNGNQPLSNQVAEALGSNSESYKVDNRLISRLALQEKGKAAVKIYFQDGSEGTEAFFAHSPTTRVKDPFAQDLALALTPSGDYVVTPPFLETSVKGVYAAGDCTSMFKVINNAVTNESMIRAGVATKLQEEAHGKGEIF